MAGDGGYQAGGKLIPVNSVMSRIKYSFLILCWLFSAHLAASPKCRNVRDADFRNHSYPLKSSEVTPGGKTQWMRVFNGRAERLYDSTSSASFYLEVVDIAYGDLTGDGTEEAAVTAIYGNNSATFFLTDTYIFGCAAGKIKLIGLLEQEQLEKDSGMALQESVKNPLQIKNGVLYLMHGTGGNRPSPEFTTTFRYRIRNGRLVPYKKPLKRRNY